MREQFEKWASGQFAMPADVVAACRYEDTYANTVLNIAWLSWAASSAPLAKELESHKRMLLAAACDIGSIGEALGADMDDDGSAIQGLAQNLPRTPSAWTSWNRLLALPTPAQASSKASPKVAGGHVVPQARWSTTKPARGD